MNNKPWLSTIAAAAALALTAAPALAVPPTAAEVGDADSFGSRVVWMGLAGTGAVFSSSDCTPDPNNPLGPDDRCVTLIPAPAMTSFDFRDLGRITLPPT
jgi:hypothetical protein